ncbi:MAG: M23 family metallopeptidase [bacterium]|nr:M23 family metallopeptidase [bacterium]
MAKKLELFYPVYPHTVNRPWGFVDSLYQKLGFVRHNGTDLALEHGQEIRAPFDCIVVKNGYQPEGSGNYICLLSVDEFEFPDKNCLVELTFMHLLCSVAKEGDELKAGDLVALGDNTGLSTGNHTHLAPKRVIKFPGRYECADENDALNTFDPEPYWNHKYAKEIGSNESARLSLQQQIDRANMILEQLRNSGR